MTAIASQITSLTNVYSTVYQTQIKENIKAPRHWPLCGEFTGTVNSPHKGPVTRKMFPFDDVIMRFNVVYVVTHKVDAQRSFIWTQQRCVQRYSWRTVYPKKCAHGFVVLCFVVVMQSFIMKSHEVFIHIHQGCFAGTGAIVRLPQCQWSKPDGYGEISQCIPTTKHSKAKAVCIFLGIYCNCDIIKQPQIWTKWPWFWRYFQMHFVNKDCCIVIQTSLKFISRVFRIKLHSMYTLIRVMTWRPTCHKESRPHWV